MTMPEIVAPFPGRGDSGEVTLVRATCRDARHDLVALGDDVLYREAQVGERVPKQGHLLAQAFRPADGTA